MSNRFHTKYHRVNHHTYTNPNNPDAGHDPIASQKQPFLGEFILSGSLSAVAPLSAYAAHFYSNNTAICAIGGAQGIYVTGTQDAIQAFSENVALSAYSPKIGILVASPNRSIWAKSGYIGIEVYSNNKAISARGLLIGLEVSSPIRAISASSNFLAGEFYSTNIAISSFGLVNGLRVESPQKAILANGSNIGLEVYSNNRGISANGINIGGEFYSTNIPLSTAFGKNLLHGFVGINTNTPTSAFEVVGDSVLYGNERITGNVRIDKNLTIYGNLSTLGDISYLDTHVTVTSAMDITNTGTGPALTVTQTGEQPVALFYDEAGHTALYIEGTAAKPGWVGIGNNNPNVALTVSGSISALSSLYIQGDTTLYGYVSANTSVFTPILSTQDIKAYGGNGVSIKTSSETSIVKFDNLGNTTLYGYVSANTSLFTPVISTQDIKAYSGNGVIIETTTDSHIAKFGNDGNTLIYNNLSSGDAYLKTLIMPVSTTSTNDIIIDFTKNAYVVCPINTTTNISFSSMQPGKIVMAILSSTAATPTTINPDSRFCYYGFGRPTTLPAYKNIMLHMTSFGYGISSTAIYYLPQN